MLSFELYGTFRAVLHYTAEARMLSDRSLELGSVPAVDEADVGLVRIRSQRPKWVQKVKRSSQKMGKAVTRAVSG